MSGTPDVPGSAESLYALRNREKTPESLRAFLAFVKRVTGADAVQLVRYGPDLVLVEDASPNPEIAANLLRTLDDLPSRAGEARTVVSTYRFGDRLVHLMASLTTSGEWLLVWLRLPESAPAENFAGLVELAALNLPGSVGEERGGEIREIFQEIDTTAPTPRRLQQFCRWLVRLHGVNEVFLVREGLVYWRVCAASGPLPSRTAPLAHAVIQAVRGRSGDSALEEVQRLTEQPAARVFDLGGRHVAVVAGENPVVPLRVVELAKHLLPLLDPPASPLHKAVRNWRSGSVHRRRAVLWGSLVLAVVLLFPVHQRVWSEAILEPAVRRFVSAPFSGVVQKVFVRTGDVVEPDQLLVELDGREIAERLADVEARLSSAILQNTTELEASNYSEAAIRALDAEGLTHERDLLRYRQNNLKLHSAIRGVIVTGEIERAEGAAVELGKPLLELAPLETLIAEIAVDETDIALVREDMTVRVKLNALAGRTFSGRILKVSPRSETRDGRNVFVAEMELPNPDGILRPGMKGRAIIFSWRRPLIWVLLRKPWQMAQRWGFR